jgi:hypothetical protein
MGYLLGIDVGTNSRKSHTVWRIVSRNRCERKISGRSLSAQGGALVLLEEDFRGQWSWRRI